MCDEVCERIMGEEEETLETAGSRGGRLEPGEGEGYNVSGEHSGACAESEELTGVTINAG